MRRFIWKTINTKRGKCQRSEHEAYWQLLVTFLVDRLRSGDPISGAFLSPEFQGAVKSARYSDGVIISDAARLAPGQNWLRALRSS